MEVIGDLKARFFIEADVRDLLATTTEATERRVKEEIAREIEAMRDRRYSMREQNIIIIAAAIARKGADNETAL
jgi:hypothetical protein